MQDNTETKLATPEGWHVATKEHPEHMPVWVDWICNVCGQQRPGHRQSFGEFFFPTRPQKTKRAASVTVINDKGEPKELTMSEFKNMRRLLFTVRRGTVEQCGHKIDVDNGPKNNCESCWFAYLNSHGELVQAVEAAYQEHGAEIIDRTRGTKFRKNFFKFLATIARFKAEQEKNGESIPGVEGRAVTTERSDSTTQELPNAA